MKTLFETPHGSHLYGMAHANSDRDSYVVVDLPPAGFTKKHWAKQTIRDGDDITVTDLSSFLRICEKGVPQALEAMFSRVAVVDELTALREGFRAGYNNCINTYTRTITNFVVDGGFKRRRHAMRLASNLSEIMRTGRFEPELTPYQVAYFSAVAADTNTELVAALRNLCPVRLDRLEDWVLEFP